MSEFVKVARRSDIPPGERLVVDFDMVSLALFNVEGDYFAIEDVCTHDGGPLAEGKLFDHAIECPRHGAMFDVRDGSVLSMPAVVPIRAYEVRLEGDDILVESPDE
ncbi:MAG: Rieske (2Fe-2S) protein [Candidatus Promineifilaceae bacterium]